MMYMAPMIHHAIVISVKKSLDTGKYQIGIRMIKLHRVYLKIIVPNVALPIFIFANLLPLSALSLMI